MVETQGCVHVVDVLQEGEEILHFLEGDALDGMERRRRRRGQSLMDGDQMDLGGSSSSSDDAGLPGINPEVVRHEPRRRADILGAARHKEVGRDGRWGGAGGQKELGVI